MLQKNRELSNSLWLIIEKLVSFLGVILVTSAVAKYIGSDNFGKLNASVYFFSIIQVIAIWGSDSIGMKFLSKNKNKGVFFLKSFNFFRVLVYLFSSSFVLCYFFYSYDRLTFFFCVSVFLSFLFIISDYYIIYNESKLCSHVNVIANFIGLALALSVRYIITYIELDPLYLCLPIILQSALPFFLRYLYFNFREINFNSDKQIQLKYNYIKYGVFSGFGLLISSVSVMIYLNVGKIFISNFDSMSSLGIYSVAISLGGAWSFVSNSLMISFTPKIFSSNNNERKELISLLSAIVLILGGLYFISFYLMGRAIIFYLYGDDFSSAYQITLIVIFISILSSLGSISAKYIISHNGFSYEAKKALMISMLSVVLSYILVRLFGMYGAAYGSLICEFLSLTVFNYFFMSGDLFKIHLRVFSFSNFINNLRFFLKK